MCQPNNQEYMTIDKTWGIMPKSGMCSSVALGFILYFLFRLAF